ncbi:hypothetical protein niasHT_006456 [Heterodera trifolii]|uniref:PI3K/PI4K catalytic domain-containing protein n=1 Tax=Heterodera trifolii TaxID=157864 RepID=A0ABD2LWZ2_9BILA
MMDTLMETANRSLTNNSLSHLTSLDHCHALALSSKFDSASSPCRCRCFPLTTKVAKSREPKRRYAFELYWQLQPRNFTPKTHRSPIKLIINGKRGKFGVIYKAGDDLRQDAVVLQLVRAMNDIWLSVQLDLRMVLFRCLPTGSKKGLMIELVPSCKTLREIQIVSSGAVAVFKDEVLNELENVPAFVCRLVCGHLCAGYWRPAQRQHFGHVFHIDFGKYIGDWQMAAGFTWCATSDEIRGARSEDLSSFWGFLIGQ